MLETVETVLELVGFDNFKRNCGHLAAMMDWAGKTGLITHAEWLEWESWRVENQDKVKAYHIALMDKKE